MEPTLTAESTTALLACCRRGMTRSTMLSASLGSVMDILATASRMYTWSYRDASQDSLMRGGLVLKDCPFLLTSGERLGEGHCHDHLHSV